MHWGVLNLCFVSWHVLAIFLIIILKGAYSSGQEEYRMLFVEFVHCWVYVPSFAYRISIRGLCEIHQWCICVFVSFNEGKTSTNSWASMYLQWAWGKTTTTHSSLTFHLDWKRKKAKTGWLDLVNIQHDSYEYISRKCLNPTADRLPCDLVTKSCHACLSRSFSVIALKQKQVCGFLPFLLSAKVTPLVQIATIKKTAVKILHLLSHSATP